jgi:hypothetical protein
MQAVADEIVLVNIDPQKVFRSVPILKYICTIISFWCHISWLSLHFSFSLRRHGI